jgi:hypothetical protein
MLPRTAIAVETLQPAFRSTDGLYPGANAWLKESEIRPSVRIQDKTD